MPIIGTAGHVDHGKSRLVRALTGRDPDRWDEEKRRGLTIDLGFAWATLEDGIEVGFVDVPGHERFVKNMLAGVDGVEVALFVVAADEGWMPQSEEHLAILDLLGIDRGVVALTRADLVDADLLELAGLEVEERLAGTSLEGAQIIPTAAPTGDGVAEIRDALAAALAAGPPAADRGRPRLWVDRSFVIAGAGTVLTGTLTGGELAVGDEVAVWPGGRDVRVRSLQSHERNRDRVGPGNRTAVNVVGLDRQEVARGAMLARAGQWRETIQALADLRTIRDLDEPMTDRGAYHLHFGSGTWPVRVRLVESRKLVGTGAALLALDDPLPMAVGDRFVLRDVGRRTVVAGGRVLDPSPARRAGAAREALPGLRTAAGPDAVAQTLLDVRGREDIAALAADSAGGRPAHGLVVGGEAVSNAEAARLRDAGVRATTEFHEANPLRAGIPKASLASMLDVSRSLLEALVADDERLADDGTAIRSAGFAGGWGPEQERTWEGARQALVAAGPAAPRASQLGLDQELLHALLREGRLTKVADDLVYLPEQLDEIASRLGGLPDEFTVAEFRDALDITRRQAVPLLEWLDRTGITVRDGDTRRLRRPQPPGREPGADRPR